MKQEQYLEIQGPMAAHLNARARGLSPTKRALLERLLTSRKSDLPAAAKSRDKRLMAYVTLRKNHSATSSDLRSFLRERLPEYMVPGEILALEEMPLTASGKIDRKRLPSMNGAGRQLEREYIGARTAIEEILVGIFEEVLRLDRVGVRDNFFEIGGHSLLATQVISRVRSAFGVEVGVRSVFEKPTVEGLARKMEEAIGAGEKDEAPPLVKASREGRLPLSFAQQRLWFIDQLEPGNAVYNCPVAVRLEGRLNLQALESAVNEIVRRHEALRTRIEAERGAPAQVIDEWKPRRLEVEDLTDLTPEEREIEALRRVREEARTGFDLSRGPLLRVKALKLGAEQHVVLFNMHHIVSDAWSMGVLIKEVCALYEATSEGKESPLPELEIQYADYAKWQREYLAGGVLEGEIAYWKEKLKDAAVLELPTDYPRPATPSYRGGSERVTLGRDVSERLKRLSQREGATLFMTLMAAFKVVLMRYSGAGGSERRNGDREPDAERSGGADRILRQHAGDEDGPLRESEFQRVDRERAGGGAGSVCAPGGAVREAGGGDQSRARPEQESAVSGDDDARERGARRIRYERVEGERDRRRDGSCEIRSGADADGRRRGD